MQIWVRNAAEMKNHGKNNTLEIDLLSKLQNGRPKNHPKPPQWGFLALLGDFGYSQNGGGTFSDFLIFFSPWLYLLITTSSSLKAVE